MKCDICGNIQPDCSVKLEIPICLNCWFDPSSQNNSSISFYLGIDKITDNLYLGNKEAQKRKKILQMLKITHILVMGEELEIYHPNDFIYKQINIPDDSNEDISKYFEECNKFINDADGKVFVHCWAGISRSASIVIAYLMKKEGKGFEETTKFVRSKELLLIHMKDL